MYLYQKGTTRNYCIVYTMLMNAIALRLFPYVAATQYVACLMLTALVSFNIPMFFAIWHSCKKIKIDETGITCFRKKRVYWSIDWERIDCVAREKIKGHICVRIIAKEHATTENTALKDGYYFQWCELGKDAIKKYAPHSVKKL